MVLGLKNEKTFLLQAITESRQALSVLTGITDAIDPVVDETALLNRNNGLQISRDAIVDLAVENNLDYLLAKLFEQNQSLIVQWQKSLATPDLTAGLAYDQRSGAFNNQVNLTLGMPLPLWNRNKGNIKMAEAQLSQSRTESNHQKLSVQTRAESLYNNWLQQKEQWNSIDTSVTSNIMVVYEGMISNFQKRNLTLLEFTDFMESFNQAIMQINDMKKSLIQSATGLNYITNKEIF